MKNNKFSRYSNVEKFLYQKDKNKQSFDTLNFLRIKRPTDKSKFRIKHHVWNRLDKFTLIAYEEYGFTELWFVIAWFNYLPSEHKLIDGDVIEIPHPIEEIIKYF